LDFVVIVLDFAVKQMILGFEKNLHFNYQILSYNDYQIFHFKDSAIPQIDFSHFISSPLNIFFIKLLRMPIILIAILEVLVINFIFKFAR